MTCAVLIVGLPSAETCPPEKTWRSVAKFVEQRLHARFGERVTVRYADLFSPDMADIPEVERRIGTEDLALPLVTVDGELVSAGGKLNVSAIERAVAAALEAGRPAPVEAAARG